MLATRARGFSQPKSLPKWQTFQSVAALEFTAYGGNPIFSTAVDEFEVVLSGGTYYLFGNNGGTDGGTSSCYGYTASSLSGTWTAMNSGAALFSGHYPTVILDSGTWRAWANYNMTLHYFTASAPGGPWTDQGVAITPPGSGPYSDWIFDPCVRKMPDSSYIMAAGSYVDGPGDIGYWTSPSGDNGSWSLERWTLLDWSQFWESPARSDGAPFITSAGEFGMTYSAYPGDTTGTGGGGMAIFDSNLGGWVMRETPLVAGAGVFNPVLYEFTTGTFTLVYANSTTGYLNYATAAAGTTPWVQRNWDGTAMP